jgi:hypothetical protein
VQRLLFVIILAILLATVVLFSPNNTTVSLADTGSQNTEGAWIRNPANGHYYMLTESMSWTEAEAWAQEWGGHLVTLRSWEEELWIKNTFGRDEYFWIGFNDVEEEGNWVWSSCEPVVYTNWEEGEPNNCGGWPPPSPCYPEHVAVMNWARSESGLEPGQFGDRWNDVPTGGRNRGVAEIVPDYILVISSTTGGSVVTPGEGQFPYKDGKAVNLVAKVEKGYRFVNWTGEVDSIADIDDASTTVTINGNYSITATFELIPEYILSISSTAGGSVTDPGEGDFAYEEGTVVDLEAEPNEGYQFADWTGDVDTVTDIEAASTTITMDDDYSIIANFEAAGGCFIATAAYGTPLAEEIQILREFRDEYLLNNPLGQGLVDIYYRISPPIADSITEYPNLKSIVRAGLMPIVAMCSIVLDIVPQAAGNET